MCGISPLGKITSRGCPRKTSWRPQDVPIWSYICNAKGRIHSGTYSRRHFNHNPYNGILWIFSWFQLYVRHCVAKIIWKPDTSCFGPIMVWGVLNKIGPLGDILRTLYADWGITSGHSDVVWTFIKTYDEHVQTFTILIHAS